MHIANVVLNDGALRQIYLRMNEVREQLFDVIRETYYLCDGPQVDGVEPIARSNAFEQCVYSRFEQRLQFGCCSVFCNNPFKAIMWHIAPNKEIRMALLCKRCCEALMPAYNDPRINPCRVRECMIMKQPAAFQTAFNVNNLISSSGMYTVYFFCNFVIFF